jgi:hypothetical protein
MLIGVEEHHLTADVLGAWNATDLRVANHYGQIERRLLDLADERLAYMDETASTFGCCRSSGPPCVSWDETGLIFPVVPAMRSQQRSRTSPIARLSPCCR